MMPPLLRAHRIHPPPQSTLRCTAITWTTPPAGVEPLGALPVLRAVSSRRHHPSRAICLAQTQRRRSRRHQWGVQAGHQDSNHMERAIPVRVFLARKPGGTGSSVRLTGNYASLGWWEPDQAAVLKPRSGGRWGTELQLPTGVEYDFKFLGVDTEADGGSIAHWESNVENRRMVIPPKAVAATVFCRWGEPRMEVFIEEPRYEQDIVNMLALPTPEKRGILMVGSSIFREWVNAPRDLEPLPVTNRAFGGSVTADQLDRLEQIVLPLEPLVILYYCGSNDLNAGVPVDRIASNFIEFSARVTAALPGTQILYVGITRCPQKSDKFHLVDSVNSKVETVCARNDHLFYLDVNHLLFSSDGSMKPRYELYQDDMLHFKQTAYQEVFVPVIKPKLQEVWNSVASDPHLPAITPPCAL